MIRNKRIRKISLIFTLLGLVFILGGFSFAPDGTMKEVKLGSKTLVARGAGIVKADYNRTTFKIKCTTCGYENEVLVIDTPQAGNPYTLDWNCPKCGEKQTIQIELK
ncbi:MAG: hypothetical protein JW774_09665 [Candidatus Aureabacteria bacterium]|nr:hypothetical protein [Candidatus Auribacterota bacterium]